MKNKKIKQKQPVKVGGRSEYFSVESLGNTPVESEKIPPVQITIRVPSPLLEIGRNHASTVGISVNSLLCIALAEYLRNRA